ncbi:MAG TPA: zinc-dependent alcohol dehydrogenase family protein [Steroidobacteraceae bacterium]|nr:zinc-dependent alcohol dehydrogenase family protein [Steroidobacteraceae bacterium]
MSNRVVRIHRIGGPEVLTLESQPTADPGPGEARVRIEAIGLNRSEAAFRGGLYLVAPKLPSPMGYEACGVIDALGSGVTGFAPGDRVCVLPNFRLGEYGVYADRAIVPAKSLIAPPPNLSSIEAASVWMQYFTAYGIVQAGRATLGDYVLIPAASSSVGLAAIQLANWIGAEPIAMTRTSAKVAALRAHGARHVIASSEVDVAAEVMRITGGKGARVVFDPVGGPFVETLAKAMADEGILIIYGSLSGQPTPYPHWSAAVKGLSLRGWVVSQVWNHPQRFEQVKDLILRGLAGGELKPVVAKTFALDDIVEAHRYLESNQQFGKIVVTTN